MKATEMVAFLFLKQEFSRHPDCTAGGDTSFLLGLNGSEFGDSSCFVSFSCGLRVSWFRFLMLAIEPTQAHKKNLTTKHTNHTKKTRNKKKHSAVRPTLICRIRWQKWKCQTARSIPPLGIP